ncbi:MAG: demethylmenaquinone methyltransferase / 2-methoxy-6-polyprenyl,4-benzoquinol methylase [Thermosipho sp. (in: thermotogales)]|nr:demethylmenaquinone methyltransferase / 2-methoxy-6-polyprenyl,4-benzoquinol methylase [Thermosipho sp. (in: thermotogales)]MDN5325052.1 demethylmenaquinone methyltransferase / 2-methoxy-6-polyprenyl,4-benzoquinol methylase [Thermosipho sp. (in: thermotogales)]
MQSKSTLVKKFFNSISSKYDQINSIISFGMDNLWRKKAIKIAKINKNDKCLDLCCGTGKFAHQISKIVSSNQIVYGLDISEKMLEIAIKKSKAKPLKNVQFILGDAMKLPFENDFFDVVITGWGLRNIPDINVALSEINRVLKSGGKFVALDMGKPKNFLIKKLFWFYLKYIVPLIGGIFSKNKQAYIYLYESSKKFPSPEELIKLLSKNGFKNTKYLNLGFGAVVIIYGEKN